MNPKTRHRSARILALSLLLAACTTGAKLKSTPRQGEAQHTTASPDSAYRTLTAAQVAQLHNAEQLLTKRCMNHHGLPYWVEPQNPLRDDVSFPYILTSPTWANKHGYGEDILAARARINEADPNQRYFRSLRPAQKQVAIATFNGTNADIQVTMPGGGVIARSSQGCMSEAEQTLYGSIQHFYTASVLYQALTTQRQNEVLSDPRWQAALPAWSRCMHSRGYDYTNPTAVRNGVATLRQSNKRFDERSLATSEAICAVGSGAAALAGRLDNEYQARIEADHPDLMNELARLRRHGLEVAAKLAVH